MTPHPTSSLLFALLVAQSAAVFNFSKCPAAWEVQTANTSKGFSVDKFVGKYYELFYHDYTQFPTCPSPSCTTSSKVFDAANNQVVDTFALSCFGKPYPVQLLFNITDQPGVFQQHNKAGFNTPDIVAYAEESTTPGNIQYDWVLELQCTTKFDHVDFIGINWYSKFKSVSNETSARMLQVARDLGFGPYMDDGFKVRTNSFDNCK
jgi:hypothetical protein